MVCTPPAFTLLLKIASVISYPRVPINVDESRFKDLTDNLVMVGENTPARVP